MKQHLVFLTYFLTATLAWSNGRVNLFRQLPAPDISQRVGILADKAFNGETVYTRIEATGAQVEAVYDLGYPEQDIAAIYFPVFALKGTSPAVALEKSKFYAHLNGRPMSDIVLAQAPADAPAAPAGSEIIWFKFLNQDSEDESRPENSLFKISYWQPHLAGYFHYLPQSLPPSSTSSEDRNWRFQMVIRSPKHLIKPPEGEVDFERMADLLIVYLKHAECVSIPVP